MATLYIVATPIGNLADITLRALEVLKEVDFIVSEDTRTAQKLLQKYAIKTPLKSYRQHQKNSDIRWVQKKFDENDSAQIAFISEAGTPGISDPGSDLVRTLRQEGKVNIIPIPGACAITAAVSVCGWQSNPYVFTGFLSLRKGRRKKFLESLLHFSGVIVIYESRYRIRKLLEELQEIFPMRDILLAREISKLYEEFIYIKADESDKEREEQMKQLTWKGEFCVLLAPLR